MGSKKRERVEVREMKKEGGARREDREEIERESQTDRQTGSLTELHR